MSSAKKIVVAGAGGFIGGRLVKQLLAEGHTQLSAVDIKPFDDWCQSERVGAQR